MRRRVRHGHKFFFIDTGIKRALDRSLHSQLAPSTSVYGEAFEHFLLLEIIKISSYLRNDWRFSYYQTREGYEIDLVIERPRQPLLLVEIKSKTKMSEHDCAVLNRLGPQIDKKAECLLLCQDNLSQQIGNTRVRFWRDFVDDLVKNSPDI